MLCSNCTNEVKPVVAVDIDGTLGDYHGHFVDFCMMYLQSEVTCTYDGTQEFSDTLGLDKNLYRQIKLAYRQGGMKRCMPVFPGARELINDLRTIGGAEVWMTTTRPWMRLDNVDPDTRFWLDNLGVTYDALLYDENKYRVLAEVVDPDRVVAVIDDLPEQIDAAKDVGLSTIHRLTQWNKNAARDPYVTSLYDANDEVMRRLERWYDHHY